MTYKYLSVFLSIVLLCTGCDASPVTPVLPLPEFVTATLPITAAPIATATLIPPTITPTVSPIAGTTTSEVNVRVDTSTASQSLGTIPAFSAVQVIGKDTSGIWFRVLINNEAGWVRSDFVQLTDATAVVPVFVAETSNGATERGVVLRGVNVRSGPGQDFDSLGLLNQNDVIPILGKDSSAAWIKISYPVSVEGTGWVAAEYLQIENHDAIPILDEIAEVPATKSAETTSQPETIPQQPILADNDTADTPLKTFILSENASHSIQFQGEISASNGDSEDWVGFFAESNNVVIQVLCESGAIKVELFQAGIPIELASDCGDVELVQVMPQQEYLLRLSPKNMDSSATINYQIKLKIVK